MNSIVNKIGGWGWFPYWFHSQYDQTVDILPNENDIFTKYDFYIEDTLGLFGSTENEEKFYIPGKLINYISNVSLRNLNRMKSELGFGSVLYEAKKERYYENINEVIQPDEYPLIPYPVVNYIPLEHAAITDYSFQEFNANIPQQIDDYSYESNEYTVTTDDNGLPVNQDPYMYDQTAYHYDESVPYTFEDPYNESVYNYENPYYNTEPVPCTFEDQYQYDESVPNYDSYNYQMPVNYVNYSVQVPFYQEEPSVQNESELIIRYGMTHKSVMDSFNDFIVGLQIAKLKLYDKFSSFTITNLLENIDRSDIIENLIMEDLKIGAFQNEEFIGSVFAEYSKSNNDKRYKPFMNAFHYRKPAVLIKKYFHKDLNYDYLVRIDLTPDLADYPGYMLQASINLTLYPKIDVPPTNFYYLAHAEIINEDIITKKIRRILGINKIGSLTPQPLKNNGQQFKENKTSRVTTIEEAEKEIFGEVFEKPDNVISRSSSPELTGAEVDALRKQIRDEHIKCDPFVPISEYEKSVEDEGPFIEVRYKKHRSFKDSKKKNKKEVCFNVEEPEAELELNSKIKKNLNDEKSKDNQIKILKRPNIKKF